MAQTKINTSAKSRGIFLTVMLVWAAFGTLMSAYSFTTSGNTEALEAAYGTVPSWMSAYLVFGIVLGVINLVGIWMMKRWGAYTLLASSIIAILMPMFFLKPLDPMVGYITIIMTAIAGGLWFWAIYRKWNQFD